MEQAFIQAIEFSHLNNAAGPSDLKFGTLNLAIRNSEWVQAGTAIFNKCLDIRTLPHELRIFSQSGTTQS